MHVLERSELITALQDLPEWRHHDDRLIRDFTFEGFKEALSFIVRVGLHAECMNHHPEIWNVYNKVRISLCTHDAGDQVTQKDVDLAREISSFDWTNAAASGGA